MKFQYFGFVSSNICYVMFEQNLGHKASPPAAYGDYAIGS